ncbi:methionine biosynthesis PLP-dependent protein [Halalkalibacterium halodurans]|uniref:Cystathionine gamma-synthase (O-succinylhomoserine (Thiol)-lyase) n=1 Tax=Halalkalibacterium halodurans (strain ATCC BAA-125 / DSM 18197 / FERM 7344 / JCM 9153 / C-125) TaxID=272558 RepID=Q9KCE4_HALH5|nr:methionine biosynthesis PLP-dependent protein [Halalkalibacterium halodurans]MED4081800.1 methionine biosynthesis PLP-dependent protein [Halalkalibacterium halodurans]MED4086463.1 methionine biosynthesis PLP-dependent protein [Halalkalibacterium halodurans]MED4105001.1 methionine biosynthesis PLP-dependent protein [Halalkalibacterium halodurans]MED4110819.1 methionine biosynthesis PLP-dependent protein [Halalkalibacterium halodurans]MED4124603.1 methionine biosynthesis PLP-dependent protein
MNRKELETALVQIGNRMDDRTGAINTPVYFSTAYRHSGIGESTGYDYARTGNPTREVLEKAIATLENGDQGFACSSGMAAIQTVFSLFQSGDEIIASQDLYGGTYRLFEGGWKKWGLSFSYADPRNLAALEQQITEKTRALFIETPTNPLMQEANIRELAALANKHGLLLIVDNTFYTPLLQQPLNEGTHIVIHSASKYLGGHNDVIAGLIVAKGQELCEQIAYYHNGIGGTLSAFDSWLLIRGMKTLALRMEQHQNNARAIASYLEKHEGVTDVLYPGRGGMLSFRIQSESWVNPFLQSLKLISFAESLGGVESLMTYPATQTHADIPEDVRIANGVCNRLLRFSVGIEHVGDLIADLDQAFNRVIEQSAVKGSEAQ